MDTELTIRDGVAFYGDFPVGRIEGATLVLHLSWLKMAGLHVKVFGDPEVDRKRDGVVFER